MALPATACLGAGTSDRLKLFGVVQASKSYMSMTALVMLQQRLTFLYLILYMADGHHLLKPTQQGF